MAEKNTADIGFEKQIWNAACVLRGNLDASEYKSVVLGLIFLKYISDRFDDKYRELLAEGDGLEEDIDEYTSLYRRGRGGVRLQQKRIHRKSVQLLMMPCVLSKKRINV